MLLNTLADTTRRMLLALVMIALSLGLAMPVLAEGPAEPWPQTQSDLKADPAVQFGTLENGMRYAIMRNTTPPKQAAIRFRIGSGSLDENEDQRGLAHFLEHMAFKGSTNVGEDEMVRILQRKGLAFGPDTNAHTSYGETVYSLDLPQVDADTISTGLKLMRETASELTLNAAAFDRERGVILAEERLRDTPQYRATVKAMNSLMEGQRVTERMPIGKTDVIRNAPVDLLRNYYKNNYRPERTTLIVVGDIDPATLEKEIRERFSDWKTDTPAPAAPDLGSLKPKGETFDVIAVPGTTTSVQIAWTIPFEDTPDTAAKRRKQVVEGLGLQVLQRRLSNMAAKADAPFIGANAGSQDLLKSVHFTAVSAESEPDKWQAALSAIDQEQRRIQEFGVSEAELQREIVAYRSMLQADAAGAATRSTTGLASMLAGSVDSDQVFTSPADDLALFDTIVGEVTAAEINTVLRQTFSGNGPQVLLQAAQAPEGGADAVRQAYTASRAVAVSELAGADDVVWPYTSFGEPGAVVERRTVDDLGLTMVRFANGVRLTVKPTKLRANEVLVRQLIGGGRMEMPHDRALPIWASPGIILSGTKALDFQDIQKVLASKIASIDFSVGDNTVMFDGRTRTEDLATQLQLMTAYTSDAAYRPEVFKRIQQAYLSGLDQYGATAGGVLGRDFAGLVHSKDPRWTFPDREQLSAATPDGVEALFRPLISKGPIEIIIVGDVTVDDAIRLTADTFGALPERAKVDAKADQQAVRFPDPTEKPVIATHSGREDTAAIAVGAPIGDLLSDIPRAFIANISTQIFENRLIDQFRIAEGATYGLQGSADLSRDLPGYGFGYFYLETTPAKVSGFYQLFEKVAADLGANPVSDDELARAREPAIETLRNQQQANDYWVRHLRNAQTDPRQLEFIRYSMEGYGKVTADEVRAFAKEYFAPQKFWKFEVLPAGIR
ncbi:zinc protease [Neorhizobium huautlense]|uniref:Zinc protease n=2 Tax=Neorhizobium huautlense TaxID=67774 RepID=A0ABT9PS10_9HYPH|nr:zinc protease [Neorhizobium huautlense]